MPLGIAPCGSNSRAVQVCQPGRAAALAAAGGAGPAAGRRREGTRWCRRAATLSQGPRRLPKLPGRGPSNTAVVIAPPRQCTACAHLARGSTAHGDDGWEAADGGGTSRERPVGRWAPAGLDQTERGRLGPNRAAGDAGREPGRRDHHLHLVPVQGGCPNLAMRVQERSTQHGRPLSAGARCASADPMNVLRTVSIALLAAWAAAARPPKCSTSARGAQPSRTRYQTSALQASIDACSSRCGRPGAAALGAHRLPPPPLPPLPLAAAAAHPCRATCLQLRHRGCGAFLTASLLLTGCVHPRLPEGVSLLAGDRAPPAEPADEAARLPAAYSHR